MTDQQDRATGLIWDERYLAHDTGAGHPERADRLTAIREALSAAGVIERCQPLAPREATDAEILAVHSHEYLDRLRTTCASGAPRIDCVDSAICPQSYEVARFSAGGALAAVDAVMAGTVPNAFCAVRPPGHHCERDVSMGFCLLANVAIAARHLRDRYKIERVAIIDWDVHHGNGTQHLFEEDPSVYFCSLHGHPSYVYPGTGFPNERGTGAGKETTLNIPFYPGATDSDYRRAFDESVLPAMDQYKPQFVLISAGFDAHQRDPLAPIDLETASYGWMTQAVADIARRHAGGRLVSVLEGGYDLQALGESVALHVKELLAAANGVAAKMQE
ncbi:MAG: histone deacetylase [Phycisphaerales bacterium]|nr:histone deacetylase [Phycisphaerales bacterium]